MAYYAAVNEDEQLDTKAYIKLLETVKKEIHTSKNRVRYTMNGFVIAVGAYIEGLTETSLNIAEQIGRVSVDVGGTACKVPLAYDYLNKTIKKGRVGKKRKSARC